jgi:hypothetical protein
VLERLLLSTLLVVLAALALSACGDSESDDEEIALVIETSAVSTDPADCETLSTLAFMEQTGGASGKKAIENCEEEARDPEGDPESVEVDRVRVDGSDARADVGFVGGTFDRQTLTVGLVEEDGDWKLDEVRRFASFNRRSLISSLDETLAEGDLSDAEADCIVEGIRELTDDELEGLVVNNEQEVIVEIAEECE